MENIDKNVRVGILACVGGFAIGYASYALLNGVRNTRRVETEMQRRKFGELLFNDTTMECRDVTTFSDITALVGSVSDSNTVDCDSTKDYLHFEIMENYPIIQDNRTLMAKYITPEIYEEYWSIETQMGCTFDQLIQSGIDVPNFPNCGFVAGDAECYDTFRDFIDPILTEKHNGFMRGVHRHWRCLDASQLSKRCSTLDPSYVEGVSFTAGRSFLGYRFLSSCNRAERREIENKLRNVFENITERNGIDFSGEYYRIGKNNSELLRNFPPESPSYWVEKPTAPVYVIAGITRDWPDARGIFVSSCPGIFASLNRDDHLRLFCRQQNADVAQGFARFCSFHAELEERMLDEDIKFAWHKDYGYLLWYPSVIGTGLKVCISLRLQHLSRNNKLVDVMRRLRLRFQLSQQPERAQMGWVEIYNGDRLGLTEVQIVETLVDGALKLIALEKKLEKSQTIDQSLPLSKKAHLDDRGATGSSF